jgi:hypothetical protein
MEIVKLKGAEKRAVLELNEELGVDVQAIE